MPLALGISAAGDIDMCVWAGEGVDMGDPRLEA